MTTAAPASPTAAAAAPRARHPPGLFLLFAVEMWERFSYYGMRALLVLYLVDTQRGGFGWDRAPAQRLYGFYGLLAYMLPVGGGYLADRFIGTNRSLVIGGAIIAAGHFCLAIPAKAAFFAGLALVVIGTGFFKSNVSTIVGQLYGEHDPRRDGGFTIFYMGVNVGALLGPLVCSYLGESPRFGWHWGFGAAGVGMTLGLAAYVTLRRRYLGDIGMRAAQAPQAVTPDGAARRGPPPLTRADWDRIVALAVIYFFVIFFWMAFEQAGSSMNLFAAERTRRELGGFSIPAGWFQSINPAVILICAPFFAALWTYLGRRGREPSTPAKMSAAMVLVGVGFAFMVAGARVSDRGALVSPLWLTAAYAFHTWGELCLSPIGLAMVTRLAPAGRTSFFMGLWFLATGISELLAGLLASFTDRIARGELFHLFGGQADFFFIFVVSSLATAVALIALTPWLKRLMHGRAA